ncbi:hypothetical protein BDN72DRAFT_218207 [Pluteus cervinus]|uniref:Uncharacterized protein n=1 Tax=Pluteus cervinus TaxID=181527 RepID=A0ACD3AHB8_9AGAR|nr:hypothetical protein BDN72DRAFT_218207 [Pluteus cervinus]
MLCRCGPQFHTLFVCVSSLFALCFMRHRATVVVLVVDVDDTASLALPRTSRTFHINSSALFIKGSVRILYLLNFDTSMLHLHTLLSSTPIGSLPFSIASSRGLRDYYTLYFPILH